jgi:hypothetical protein
MVQNFKKGMTVLSEAMPETIPALAGFMGSAAKPGPDGIRQQRYTHFSYIIGSISQQLETGPDSSVWQRTRAPAKQAKRAKRFPGCS